jgi:hypothetical protein
MILMSTINYFSQLECEGSAQENYRHWPHAFLEDCAQAFQVLIFNNIMTVSLVFKGINLHDNSSLGIKSKKKNSSMVHEY